MNANLLSDQKLKLIKNYLQQSQILDVGAGLGHYSKWICQNYRSVKVVALDHIESESFKHCEFIKTDLEKTLSFQGESFDTILAFDVIEHIQNCDQLLSEIFRVCKKDGILIGSVPHDKDDFLPDYNLTFYHRSDVTHKRYYVAQSLKEVLRRAGFEVLKIEKLGGVNPQVISEFFPNILKPVVKKMVGLCRRIKLIDATKLKSDLFFVAKKL